MRRLLGDLGRQVGPRTWRASAQVRSSVAEDGASAAQPLLAAGELDELEISLVPVLLAAGRRLFESHDDDPVELDHVRTIEGRQAMHLRHRIRHDRRLGS